jgi:hypothetical protein
MIPFAYCKDWSFAYKRVHKPMSEKDAKEIHLRRAPFTGYSAVFGTPDDPTHRVEVSFNETDMFYVVAWIDEMKRKHTEYQFRLQTPDRLFLIMASEFWYDGDTDRVTQAAHYNFELSGRVHVDKFDKVSNLHEFKEAAIDVSGNWEPLPAFGAYDGLLVLDRDLLYGTADRSS